MLNLIQDAVFQVLEDDAFDRCVLTLPDIYALCAEDAIAGFPALRAHQAPAWHAFLVQLGVMACEAGDGGIPDTAEGWRAAIRALTPDWPGDEPWQLVVDDLSRPAFLQPPVPEGSLDDWKVVAEAPDAADMLITSKNHDLKQARMVTAQPDDWVFALVSLQTQEGIGGAGNYGVVRMNGGYGSRPHVRLQPTGAGFGAAVIRDIHALLNAPADLRTRWQSLYLTSSRLGLLWLEPWTGAKPEALQLESLHPLFIEICRRRRLVKGEGRLFLFGRGTKGQRVAAAELRGALFDPWIPIDTSDGKGPKALSIPGDGFTYRRTLELFKTDGRLDKPFLAHRAAGEGNRPMTLVLSAISRGQGKTEGFHERRVTIPADKIPLLDDWEGSGLDELAETMTEFAAGAQTVLRRALIIYVQGGPDGERRSVDWTKPSNGPLTRPWVQRLDRQIDTIFFDQLWALAEQEDAKAVWKRKLADMAAGVLEAALPALPCDQTRHWLAAAAARDAFRNMIVGKLELEAGWRMPEVEAEHA